MTKSVRSCLALGFILIASSTALAEQNPGNNTEAESRITVRVYDYAHAPRNTLAEAEKVGGRLFNKAGVTLVWLDCTVAEGPAPPTCSQPPASAELVLRVLPGTKKARTTLDFASCGFSFKFAQAEAYPLASVFYDCAEWIARVYKVSRGVILGHLVAHELGHLLLPSGGHSSKGVMQANLDSEGMKRASMGALVFTPEEGRLLRAEVTARAKRQEAAEQAARLASGQ